MDFYRLLKKLRRKDRKQVQIERKEKGFSLYINGANTELSAPATNHTQRVKTATGKSHLIQAMRIYSSNVAVIMLYVNIYC